ncbi:SHOCT domain-containing protein [Sulfurimonas sp. SAG-AH-194-C21]|nr:SHOCT domain-containing protein [Sulfurimonas sp. SAG-AH-194-C21]MDF1882972.1 SHOCT domain-containing protein [Sulfurimonas sp. SAG-AH-194-C21]
MGYFFLWLFFGIFAALLASNRNRSAIGWFFIGFVFGPFGLLFAFFMKHGDVKEKLVEKKKPKVEKKASDIAEEEYQVMKDKILGDKKEVDTKDSSKTDSIDKLIKLADMLEKGLITEEEFNAQKASIL